MEKFSFTEKPEYVYAVVSIFGGPPKLHRAKVLKVYDLYLTVEAGPATAYRGRIYLKDVDRISFSPEAAIFRHRLVAERAYKAAKSALEVARGEIESVEG